MPPSCRSHQRVTPLAIIDFVKKLFSPPPPPRPEPEPEPVAPTWPRVYPRPEHIISRSHISDNALKVLGRLRQSGYQAYLVGGCVRDLLLGREPKDFDVVTDARPEEVREVFRNCRLVGRRFRLAHVYFGDEIVEVATFRSMSGEDSQGAHVRANGRILRDNAYGNIEDDAFRRDFTVNALYYNIEDFSVVDYVGGMDDHKAAILRLIGDDPEQRYREDPVRMLRAVRFAVKLGFSIHPDCAEPMPRLARLLGEIPPARLYDEMLKLFLGGYAVQTFEQLRQHGLFAALFPDTERCLGREPEGFPLTFLAKSLENTDQRIGAGKPVTPYFLFAALLWEPTRARAESLIAGGQNPLLAYQDAAGEVIARQVQRIAIPRTLTLPIRELWSLQPRLENTTGRAFRMLGHPRFRAAYDFLVLRAATGEADPDLADWWTRFQTASEAEQKAMTRTGRRQASARSKPRKRRNRAKSRKQDASTPTP
ncbi:poly(A) polymerase [Methylomagnum ishizawai]|uniref:Poly(A) polymerase I n=2 Tax=Methylomagnum ishizawai TaxID=1760988 RepID=A0A1Y6CS69_9GAMM|nr:poly(A) polymerase [Methylomagnum ishizawai]